MTTEDQKQWWRAYLDGGWDAVAATARPAAVGRADDALYLALLALHAGRAADAAAVARLAARLAPDDAFLALAAEYLVRRAGGPARGLYDVPADEAGAFAAFIREGGNVALYATLSARLRAAYAADGVATLLDIGVGDGLALLPALAPPIPVQAVTLVEPAAALLEQATAALTERGVSFAAFNGTIQAFLAQMGGVFDMAQATFALHNLSPAERQAVFRRLRRRCRRLVVAEFDVAPAGPTASPGHVASLVGRYRRGLAEYGASADLVGRGFLLPVFCANFEPDAGAAIYEQPATAWAAELAAAGFRAVTVEPLVDYWWAPAVLIAADGV